MPPPRRTVSVGYRDPRPRKIADPADGATITRCRSCGWPTKVAEIVGMWQGAPVRYPVCETCILAYIVRDPLTAV